MPLVMSKATNNILIKEPNNKTFQSTDRFFVNDLFTSKLYYVKINPITIKIENDIERNETRNKVDSDRKYEVDAAIIRIMKTSKTMLHTQLIAEVRFIS
jgi:cullin 3